MIRKVTLGPRSRVLEAMDRANAELGAKVMGGLLPDDDQVVHPPTPGPANPTSVHGCGCARFHLPNKADLEIDGVVHRYSRPCYREGTSKQLGAETREMKDGKTIDVGWFDEARLVVVEAGTVRVAPTVTGGPRPDPVRRGP